MTELQVDANEPQGTHFWFLTMQTPNAAGYYLSSYQGTFTPPAGATRLDAFNEVRQLVERNDPPSRGGTVLAFDIQPNQI
jgi:hypothetical protein